MESGDLVDILLGDHQSEWDARSFQRGRIEIGCKRNHGYGSPYTGIFGSLRRGIAEAPVDHAARHPTLDAIEEATSLQGDEADTGREIIFQLVIAMVPKARVGPHATGE